MNDGLAVMVAVVLGLGANPPTQPKPSQAKAGEEHMQLTSSAFGEGAMIPVRFTCDGENRPPPLHWSEPPRGTQSLALVVDDPDAPRGTWHHWAVFDIPASARDLDREGPLYEARNDFGQAGYGGPCPPRHDRPHHYRFRLFALDVPRLAIGTAPTAADVERAMKAHVIAEARLTGLYQRKQ